MYSIVSFLASTEWSVQLIYIFALLSFLPLPFLDTQSLFSSSFCLKFISTDGKRQRSHLGPSST